MVEGRVSRACGGLPPGGLIGIQLSDFEVVVFLLSREHL